MDSESYDVRTNQQTQTNETLSSDLAFKDDENKSIHPIKEKTDVQAKDVCLILIENNFLFKNYLLLKLFKYKNGYKTNFKVYQKLEDKLF